MSSAIDSPLSQALITDLYQLTMAYGYWKSALKDHRASFSLFFRKAPFGGSYALACGLGLVIPYLREFQFSDSDLEFLRGLKGEDNKELFEPGFLIYLRDMRFSCDLHAMPEGSLAFPNEPLLRVEGPLIQAQLLETSLLTLMNFQTLVATKAARICQAAEADSVLEFGLRRAQGIDGGLAASRAAYIGGCAGTSNLLAGKRYDIPVKGTHAHSWVLAFDTEPEAFLAYVKALPNNVTLLVDTFDTLQGVKNAIEAGKVLRDEKAGKLLGIRLDSGDLKALSIQARQMLDAAGFTETAIVASNDLDEYRISELKASGAKIDIWGVGTRLATAYDEPALTGVYKLTAIQGPGESWKPKMKLSESAAKTSDPGILQVVRYRVKGEAVTDVLVLESEDRVGEEMVLNNGQRSPLPSGEGEYLLQSIFEEGHLVYLPRSIHQKRTYAQEQLASLPQAYKTLQRPGKYPVGRSESLWKLRNSLKGEL